MDHRVQLVTRSALRLAGLLLAGSSYAGYAMVTPPAGVGGPLGGSPLSLNAQAANAAVFNNKAVLNVTTNVGGKAVTMPASMSFAANAGRFAMSAIRFNPMGLAIGIGASFMLEHGLKYVEEEGWLKRDEREVEGWACFVSGFKNASCDAAVNAFAASVVASTISGTTGASYRVDYVNAGSPGNPGNFKITIIQTDTRFSGVWETPITGSLRWERDVRKEDYWRPAGDPDFEPDAPPVMPPGLPEFLPVPLPVELPVINPSPLPSENPDATPVPRPYRVPVGEPYAVPGTDPAQWRQPVIDVVPAPRPDAPWRVDHQPREVPVQGPSGVPQGPVRPGDPMPAPTPQEGKTDCEKFPNASMCQPLGTAPDEATLEEKLIPLDITPLGGFGPSNASCPADKQIALPQGITVAMSWRPMCDFATMIRPIVVGMAWVSAALAFLGLSRREG